MRVFVLFLLSLACSQWIYGYRITCTTPEVSRNPPESDYSSHTGDANATDGPLLSKTTNIDFINTSPRICNEVS